MVFIDAKSIKNTDTTREKWYDAGKKISGIKLHVVVNTIGLFHAIYITPDNVTNRKGAVQMIGLNINSLSAVKVFSLMLDTPAINL